MSTQSPFQVGVGRETPASGLSASSRRIQRGTQEQGVAVGGGGGDEKKPFMVQKSPPPSLFRFSPLPSLTKKVHTWEFPYLPHI